MKLKGLILSLVSTCVFVTTSLAQEVEILSHSTDENDLIRLEIDGSADQYYTVRIRHDGLNEFRTTSITKGIDGSMTLTEPIKSYPIEHYRVESYPLDMPVDQDGDGSNDIEELDKMPKESPLNFAREIDFFHGSVGINGLTTFQDLSVIGANISWSEFLNDKDFVKFVIDEFHTDNPEVYFVNSETHYVHADFMDSIGINKNGDVLKGEIIFHPDIKSENGLKGMFSFNYTFGYSQDFETVRKTHELLSVNMPFLKNNMAYYITDENINDYEDESYLYDDSRVPILYESDVFANVDYLALNPAEGYGLFRLMELEDTPNSRDIVLYESLPNKLPRVGGIMTSFIQTPLSHVNLRAIQDNVPNAYIADPLLIDSIVNLLDKYIYFKVEQNQYFIREATQSEVDEWYESIRPTKDQVPALNLSYTSILPLEEINFGMSDGFGAKCANLATIRKLSFPDNTIPNGFGVPFYYYQDFMHFNNFFEEVETMLADPDFQNDLNVRVEMLDDFRKRIRAGNMPDWMLEDLNKMHTAFPNGTSIRCRSSTNNEDLPGFSGAGLYTSKTQHPDEGHISKSIKQVYASMWNFRAFDERDFYRIDHFAASMGVLCHPNYSDEKANGVGITTDPIYQTEKTFYINTQIGEDLVTNPDAFSTPEEILLDTNNGVLYEINVVRNSNLTPNNETILSVEQLINLTAYMYRIHRELQVHYNANDNEDFAIDVEYKITSDDQLIIKQARPWAYFWSDQGNAVFVEELQLVDAKVFPIPTDQYLNIETDFECASFIMYTQNGSLVLNQKVNHASKSQQLDISSIARGSYILLGISSDGKYAFSKKIIKI